MELENLVILFGHGMETRLWKLVVIVVMTYRDACYAFGERPKTIQLHILTEFHCCTGDHEARRQTIGFDTLSSPELSKTFEIPWIEKYGLLLRTELFQGVMYFERRCCVASKGKSR